MNVQGLYALLSNLKMPPLQRIKTRRFYRVSFSILQIRDISSLTSCRSVMANIMRHWSALMRPKGICSVTAYTCSPICKWSWSVLQFDIRMCGCLFMCVCTCGDLCDTSVMSGYTHCGWRLRIKIYSNFLKNKMQIDT